MVKLDGIVGLVLGFIVDFLFFLIFLLRYLNIFCFLEDLFCGCWLFWGFVGCLWLFDSVGFIYDIGRIKVGLLWWWCVFVFVEVWFCVFFGVEFFVYEFDYLIGFVLIILWVRSVIRCWCCCLFLVLVISL